MVDRKPFVMRRFIFLRSIGVILFVLVACQLVAQPLATAKPEDVGMSSDRLKRFTDVYQQYVDSKRMPGSVTLVMRKGKVVYFQAFGYRDVESKSPMTKDAIFRIASQTKALISVGIMMLQEEGKLLITEPVSKYIPEFSKTTVAVPKEGGGYDVVPAKREIVIRDLLTHTSGIGYGEGVAADRWKAAGIQGWYFADRKEPIGATVARMATLPNDAQPGERWVYGYSTDILGVVIEKVSGMPLDQFIKTKITDPLGMTDTYFYLPKDKAGRFATTYALGDNGVMHRSPDESSMSGQGAYVNGPRTSFSGGAGLLSTATDYARFLQMMLNGGELNGVRLLSPKTVELMTVSHTKEIGFRPGEGFGLGFSVVTDVGTRGMPGSVGEYGWGGAYGSNYWVDPNEELVVVYFKQLRPMGGPEDQFKLRTLIYQAIVK